MKLQTKYLGEVYVSRKDIIYFDTGLPAFENEKKFTLLPFNGEAAFHILQSVQTPQLAFIVTDPFTFFPDYEVKLTDGVVSQLEIDSEEDVAVLSVLTVQHPFKNTTANLQAPIILNTANNRAKQHVMSESIYEPKHYLFPLQIKTPSGTEGEQ